MRDHLVVARCGRHSRHPAWVAGPGPRTFDLWLCPYEDAPGGADLPALTRTIPGGKWGGLARLLAEERAWERYAYVWLPDDDVDVDAASLSRFFAACRELDAALAAPALAEGAQFSHLVTLRNRAFRHRRTTFVEIMAPCFRADTLAALLPTFAETTTGHGWGLDDVWARRLGYRGLFVVDDVPVRHDRPVGAARTRAQRRVLRAELRRMRRRFDACSLRKTLGGLDVEGVAWAEADAGFLARYLEGYRWLDADEPGAARRLRRDQAKDPEAWLRGAEARARRGGGGAWWRRVLGRDGA